MALSLASLKAAFQMLLDQNNPGFLGFPTSIAQAVDNWATVYDNYATAAMDVSGDLLVSANKGGFIAALNGLLPTVPPGGTPAEAASAFEAAFAAYWMGAEFAVLMPPVSSDTCPNIGGTLIFSAEASSVVTAVVPNFLRDLLLAEFSVISSDSAAKADLLATAFHTATTSAVQVLITGLDTTPSPSGPLPITNLCTVF